MNQKRHLVLVRGGAQELGPVSRMGLWRKFPQQSKGKLAFYLGAKTLLVSAMLYYWLA
jgi:hypothetical protein